jgi:putative DNA-invertase from lambdoid prophage Rac
MRTLLYARVSTSDQDCQLQVTELHRYCEAQRWTATQEYVDTGFSGAKADRPALQALMKEARRGDTVVVYKLDRFGRSAQHLLKLLDDLKARGCRFIAISQGIDTGAEGSGSAAANLLFTILAGIAEFERELIRERTLLGVRAAQAAGKAVGRPRRVFRRDLARNMRASGASWRAISAQLGVPVATLLDAARGDSGEAER